MIDVSAYHESDHSNVHSVLTVEQIITPRSDFLSCSISDRFFDAFADLPDVYDAVPVVDGQVSDLNAEVVGLLRRSQCRNAKPHDQVSAHMDERPAELKLFHSNSILHYARNASADWLSFVSDSSAIIGLVTLYDLERLPVRLRLFQHLLHFEQLLGDTIIVLAPDEAEWAELAREKRDEIKKGIRRAQRRDHHGSEILGIGFTEKVEIARKLLVRDFKSAFNPSLLDHVALLRNDVAHGLPFKRVDDVPVRVSQIDEVRSILSSSRVRPQP